MHVSRKDAVHGVVHMFRFMTLNIDTWIEGFRGGLVGMCVILKGLTL